MSLRKYLFALVLISFAPSAGINAESIKEIHRKAHSEQLANAKSALDKNVIQNFILNEIDQKENNQESANKISAELTVLLQDLIGEAKSHLGQRYRSGGKGPNAFDCSGFSSYVFKQFGYKLGASSKDQFTQGEKIEDHELRAGDLVFFTGRNRSRGVGHVGIVIEADKSTKTFKFIHAATSGGIRIDSNKGYYEGRYLGARIIINDL